MFPSKVSVLNCYISMIRT